MVRDLVCGASLEIGHAVRVDYHGAPYYFCSHDCKAVFEDRPEEFAQAQLRSSAAGITSSAESLVELIRQGVGDH